MVQNIYPWNTSTSLPSDLNQQHASCKLYLLEQKQWNKPIFVKKKNIYLCSIGSVYFVAW